MVGGTTKLAGGGWLWAPNNKYLVDLGVRQPEDEIVDLLISLAYPNASASSPPDENDVRLCVRLQESGLVSLTRLWKGDT